MVNEYIQEISICPQCGFIFTANPFNEELLSNRYRHLSKFEFDSKNQVMEEDVSYKKRCYRQYSFIKNTVNNISSVFEVGSASGFNLSLYHNKGMYVYGIEPSERNVVSCKERYGIDLFNGMFQEYIVSTSNTKKYDLIFLSHVLEHIINPYQFILELSKINNRYMFIEVPTFDYKFIDEPFGMFAEEHVNYFTFENLRYLMNCLDYHIVDANIYFSSNSDIPAGYPILSTIWEKKTITCNSLTSSKPPVVSSYELLINYLKKSEELQTRINTIIDDIEDDKKLAVWGTGHHTSRLLGMSNLCKKNIVKFYDSDLRKKNSSYFNRNISPFNPLDIMNGIVETILISTYVAQQAIIKNIEKSNSNCNYIKLY
jgi:hypothetical protein